MPRTPVDLEIRDLRLVDAIVQQGSLERAGTALHLTESAVSRRLADLERRCPQRLFLKQGRRLVLTAAGEALRAATPAALQAIAAAERALEGSARRQAPVRVATQCYTVYSWVPKALRELRQRVAGADLAIVPDATRDPFAALLDQQIDLAITHRPPSSRRLEGRPLFADRLVAVCGPGHPWADRSEVTPADFADQHLMTYAVPWATSHIGRQVFAASGAAPREITTIPLTEAMFELIAAEVGVAVLASWAVGAAVARGQVRVVPLRGPGVRRRWYGVTRRGESSEPALAALLELLAAVSPPQE